MGRRSILAAALAVGAALLLLSLALLRGPRPENTAMRAYEEVEAVVREEHPNALLVSIFTYQPYWDICLLYTSPSPRDRG